MTVWMNTRWKLFPTLIICISHWELCINSNLKAGKKTKQLIRCSSAALPPCVSSFCVGSLFIFYFFIFWFLFIPSSTRRPTLPYTKPPPVRARRRSVYLCLGQAERRGQLHSLRRGQVPLDFEPLLQAGELRVGENRPGLPAPAVLSR